MIRDIKRAKINIINDLVEKVDNLLNIIAAKHWKLF